MVWKIQHVYSEVLTPKCYLLCQVGTFLVIRRCLRQKSTLKTRMKYRAKGSIIYVWKNHSEYSTFPFFQSLNMSNPLPKTQALSSTTFNIPPLDGSLTLPGLYDWHYEHSPDHPLFVFEDIPGVLRTICYREAGQAIMRASRYTLEAIGDTVRVYPGVRPVIAILAMSDTVTFFCTIVGILRLGWTVFPISTRNSPAAIAALLTQTKSRHMFLSSDPAISALASSSLRHLSADSLTKTYHMPSFEDLFPTRGPEPSFEYLPMPKVPVDAPAMILHSSGTTAYPSPIPWTHRAWIQFGSMPHYGELDWTGRVLACHAVPMFHGMGIVQITLAPSSGLVVGMFKPRAPATIPDPVNTLLGAIATKSDIILSVPLFLEVSKMLMLRFCMRD